MKGKIDSYKAKITKLNETIKENADNLSALLDRKITLEKEIIKLKQELSKEREKFI